VSQPVGIGGGLTTVVNLARGLYFAGRETQLTGKQAAAFEAAGGTREWIKTGNIKTPQLYVYRFGGETIDVKQARKIARRQMNEAFTTLPNLDVPLPPVLAPPGVPPAVGTVVGRVLGPIGWILFPGETAPPELDVPAASPPQNTPPFVPAPPPFPDFENFGLPPWLLPRPPGDIFAPFFPDPTATPLPAPLPAPTVQPIPEPPIFDPTAPIETVTVTAPRPAPYQPPELLPVPAPVFAPTPAPLPAPTPTPRPIPQPYSSPTSPNPFWWLAPIPGQWSPRPRPRDPAPSPVTPPTVEPFTPSIPAPFAPGAPAPFAPPAPLPTQFPFAPPAPAPLPTQFPFAPPSVGPGSTPFPFLPPLPGLTPFNPTGVGYNPLPAQFAQPAKPPNDQDRCRCTSEKKRKRKKREDRKVCWQGTYREMARGVIKHRKERVSCRP